MEYFKGAEKWDRQWDQFFNGAFWNSFENLFQNIPTQANIYQSGDELLVIICLPGLQNVNDIDLFVCNKSLELKGNIDFDFEGYELIEEGITTGKIDRSIKLPFPVRDDRYHATYKNGLLMLKLYIEN